MHVDQLLGRIDLLDAHGVNYLLNFAHAHLIWSQTIEYAKIKVVFELVAHIQVLNAGGHLLHEVVVHRFLVVRVG